MAPELYSIADGNVAGCGARQHSGFGISVGRVFLAVAIGRSCGRTPVETRPSAPKGGLIQRHFYGTTEVVPFPFLEKSEFRRFPYYASLPAVLRRGKPRLYRTVSLGERCAS